jgi:uncharacterized protein
MRETAFELVSGRGWTIRGEVRKTSGGQEGIVVICHGFKGFKDWGFFPWVGRQLADRGFTAVSFNFSGSGIGKDPLQFTEVGLFERNTFSTEIDDLLRVFDSAVAGELPGTEGPHRLGPALLAHSRGAVAALVAAAKRPDARRVVTWAGIGSLRNRFDEATREEWRRTGSLEVVNARTGQVFHIGLEALDDLEKHLDDYDPLRVVAAIEAPVLVIHGSNDATVPVSEGRTLAAVDQSGRVTYLEIDGAGHTFEAVHPFAGPTPSLQKALEASVRFLLR